MTDPRALAELVRLPAALTVPGDSLAGAAAAGWPHGRRTLALPLASACLYWSGMALNDWSDRKLDAVERPERPLPSGRVAPAQALALAAGLTAGGLAVAAAAGGRDALRVAVPLAVTVWAYDLVLKPTPAGPVAMAAARGFDVLLGAGAARARASLPAALPVAVHTLALTVLSRGEVRGAGAAAPAAALAATAAVTAAAVAGPAAGRRDRAAGAALAAGYAVVAGRPQLRALRDPSAGTVRAAVGAGILAMMPLQAALAARARAVPAAVVVAGALPLARLLTRRASAT